MQPSEKARPSGDLAEGGSTAGMNPEATEPAETAGEAPGETGTPSPDAVREDRGSPEQAPPAKSALRETVETVLTALVIALLIRSFLVQLYVVDGESMFPTLHHMDRLLVNKIVYRLRQPQPGEIIVLEDPANPRRQLIKRVIAVGGETVEIRNRVTFLNGKPLVENFTNPVSVHFSDVQPYTVPEGYIYVMGDNRGGSLDSRILGPIELSKVEGKAFFMFWPLDRFGKKPLEVPRTYME